MNHAWALVGPLSLAVARLFGILRAHVLLRHVTGVAWWAISAVLAIGLSPLVLASTSTEPTGGIEWVALVVLEFGLGTVLGTVLSFPGHAVIGSAQLVGIATLQGPRQKTMAAMVLLVAASLGWALSLHHALFETVVELARQFPVADIESWGRALDPANLPRLAHGLCVLALALATPVLLTAAVADAALRLTGQSGEQDWTASLRPWVITAGALIALGASWSAFPQVWGHAALIGS